MLEVGRFLKPHHLVTIGDIADCYAVSDHSKDPRRLGQLEDEVADVNKGLDELDSLGATSKIFVGGNHCDRLRRYLQDKAPQLFNTVSIPTLFRLKERGWKYVPYKDDTKIGKLHITHDVGTAGRNAAFKALDTYQHTIITGHTHRLQYIVEGNAVNEFKLSAMFGWLGDVNQIDYMHRTTARKNWVLGFGIGYLDPQSGIAYLTPVPIVAYTCCVNGRLFRG